MVYIGFCLIPDLITVGASVEAIECLNDGIVYNSVEDQTKKQDLSLFTYE